MDDKVTLVVTATPNSNEMESVQAYLKGVFPLLMSAGGQLVKRLNVEEAIGGEQNSGMILVMDFESKDKVVSMFASEEYKALIPVRDRGFAKMNMMITRGM